MADLLDTVVLDLFHAALADLGEDGPRGLLRHIETPALDVELMLKRVRQDVFELTDKTQEPWVNSALRREFRFNPQDG